MATIFWGYVSPCTIALRRRGLFLRPMHVRDFVKEGCFFVPRYEIWGLMADFKFGVNTDVNIGVSVTRGGNTLFEVMGIC